MRFEGRKDYRLDPIRQEELPHEMRPNNGILRILPGAFEAEGGADGFFVARFTRD